MHQPLTPNTIHTTSKKTKHLRAEQKEREERMSCSNTNWRIVKPTLKRHCSSLGGGILVNKNTEIQILYATKRFKFKRHYHVPRLFVCVCLCPCLSLLYRVDVLQGTASVPPRLPACLSWCPAFTGYPLFYMLAKQNSTLNVIRHPTQVSHPVTCSFFLSLLGVEDPT